MNIVNNGRAIFASDNSPYSITLTAKPNSLIDISWKLTSLGRTLSSGVKSIRLNTRKNVKAYLPLRTPPVKSGVKVKAQLIIDAVYSTDSTIKEHYEFDLDIYGENIFLHKQSFYQKLNIQLFDPVGQTSNIFDKLKIPYSTLSRSKLINFSDKGFIVIGVGVDINHYRGLPTVLIELAHKGHQLLILQPASATLPLSKLASGLGASSPSIFLSNETVIPNYIQNYQWDTDSGIKSNHIILNSNRQEVSAQVVESKHEGWDWFHLNYHQSQGKLIICMLPFIDQLDRDPIKQIIFGQLLNYASNQSKNIKNRLLKE
ncbi:hypothetical protein [Colwellia sp. 75C3]|uniref:hypothetical protein n=1 Tax=Colwellia sp. 75C3 TaxID=888425 RepID=UPI001E379106|nr:hypothetical protein [Colwellia sp. 75C3]